ncbi:MAG TPA: DNA polymerase IV [Bacteroidetes bacterium]|nr:DNA polymerase IV [Bacteroidota bacterium]
MFRRAIGHFDLDAFFASVEILKNSSLRGKPLIIGGRGGRGVVSSCSYEARRFGVRSAMPVKMALRLCPGSIVLRGDMEEYSRQSRLVTEIIQAHAPVFEKASIDEFYLDLSGMDKYFGCWQWSRELRQRIVKETGLPISMGLSVNKTVSKIGTGEAKPAGEKLVAAGTEKAFMAPLSIRKIPGLGKQTFRKLSFMGVRDIRTLSQVPPKLLQREFGKQGLALWKKSNGIDNSPVVPHDEQKSISTERTFQTDTLDVGELKGQLTRMVTELAFKLRRSQKLVSCVTIKIRYTDFNTYTRQKRIAYTANDGTLIHHSHLLFDQLFARRQLLRLIGVRFSGLVNGNYQIRLFEDTQAQINLLTAMDGIRNRFGKGAISRASTLNENENENKN